ncbi:MAG: formate/nitrite transporter family protein [Bacillota bacterium]|jgi:formate/nitrite transporter
MAFKTPSEVAATAVGMGVAKSRASSGALTVLGFLAGSFIAISAVLSHTISYSLGPWAGPSVVRIISGLPFSLGIVMVIVGGGELFTGNSLMVMALIDKRIPFGALTRNWIIVYFANMAGAIFVAWLYYRTGLWESADGTCAESLMAIAVRKSSLGFWPAFFRGVLCNWLVCMGVWMSYSADDVVGRLVPSAMAVSAFVMCGAENSVANMFYIPAGFMVSSTPVAECVASLARNLLPVTFGNVVGGGLLVGTMYWWAYVRHMSEARGVTGR